MKIDHPTAQDRQGLVTLWQEAFGDNEAFVEMFFSTGFSPDRCFVCKEDSVLGALYWFDCLWNGKKVAYLYAIATKKEHRGKGICKALMEKTHQHLAENGYFGAILVPAEVSLFAYYGKMGYHPCCPRNANTAPSASQSAPISVAAYQNRQTSLLPENAVTHTDAAFLYLSHFAKFYETETGILCQTDSGIQEQLPYTPGDTPGAMYLPLTEDETLPGYFALPLS